MDSKSDTSCSMDLCPEKAQYRVAFVHGYEVARELDTCDFHYNETLNGFRHSQLSSAHEYRQAASNIGVQCDITLIVMPRYSNSCAVYLREFVGTRMLILELGPFETWGLYWALRPQESTRPMMHEAFRKAVVGLGGTITALVVDQLLELEAVFSAKLHILQGTNSIYIDVRPSDGLSLAVSSKAPIFVRQELFDRIAVQ